MNKQIYKNSFAIGTEGRTSRQLAGVARWMFVVVMVAAMLAWFRPGEKPWWALSAGIFSVLTLWTISKISAGSRTVPGMLVYLIFLVPAIIAVYHFAGVGLGKSPSAGLRGGMIMSGLFQLSLIALAVMLSGCLFSASTEMPLHTSVLLSVCGLSMMLGPAAAVASGSADGCETALSLVGLAGVGVWLTPLTEKFRNEFSVKAYVMRRWWLRGIYICVAGMFVGVFAFQSALALVIAIAAVGVVAFLFAVFAMRRGYIRFILAGAGALLAAGMVWKFCPADLSVLFAGGILPFGRGEDAFATVWGGQSGLMFLLGVIGWWGVLFPAGIFVFCAAFYLYGTRDKDAKVRLRTVLWTVSVFLCAAAMLTRGGLFIPCCSLGLAFAIGLWPVMSEKKIKQRSGLWLLGTVFTMMVLLALARDDGLIMWSAIASGGGDRILHFAVGFLFSLMAAWFFGAKNVILGVIVILLSALAGGAGEWLQGRYSTRGVEMKDWIYHVAGSCAVIAPYLLAFGSKLCESREEYKDSPAENHGE